MKKSLILLIGLLVILVAGVLWWMCPSASPKSIEQETVIQGVTREDSSAEGKVNHQSPSHTTSPSQQVQSFHTGLEALPRSLQGTDVDGDIIINQNQQLVVTEGLRRLFDYFLSALGEEDESTIQARVEAYINSRTPEPAASQAITIFHQYVAYLKALSSLEKRYGHLQMQATQEGSLDRSLIAQRTQDIARIRKQHFSNETIQAFFQQEDQLNDYTVAMVDIANDTSLNDEQKEAAKQEYVSRLPDGAIKQRIQQSNDFTALIRRTDEMKAKGATAEELFAMRSQVVGVEAAQRLAALDAEEADFDKRFTQYQQGKKALIAQYGSQQQAQSQIDMLEAQLFDSNERKRLTGYAMLKEAQQ
ncbi:lipase secretion chaperone [Psychrobacter sp. I-STPA6b]|uniref:lipase secretion chaperone n=1 Tax=Psychrobacter sp. I-STPA6b TaxID=2585718 RepID=UPI001D0C40CC|nr:lipase secretion chaperone [Psychrobacter sp. I-STPA6b]